MRAIPPTVDGHFFIKLDDDLKRAIMRELEAALA
jgi:hypothetical protein